MGRDGCRRLNTSSHESDLCFRINLRTKICQLAVLRTSGPDSRGAGTVSISGYAVLHLRQVGSIATQGTDPYGKLILLLSVYRIERNKKFSYSQVSLPWKESLEDKITG